jgi:hypothetical protein
MGSGIKSKCQGCGAEYYVNDCSASALVPCARMPVPIDAGMATFQINGRSCPRCSEKVTRRKAIDEKA